MHGDCRISPCRGDFEGLCSYLSNCDFSYCYQSDDIEFVWRFISSIIKQAIDLFVPSTVMAIMIINLSGLILKL